MQWYYLDQNQRQVEAREHQLHDLRDRGVINDETLVWNDSLPQWTPVRKALPENTKPTGDDVVLSEPVNSLAQPPNPAASGASSDIRVFASILAQNAGWIRFLGILSIIYGVVLCLSLIGAVIGWIPIWIGKMLMNAASSAQDAQSTGSRYEMTVALEKISKYLKTTAVLTLIGILVGLVSGIVSLVMAMSGSGS